jgi:3-oxoacyl-[acyl-carrier-protein] synthase-1
MNLGEAAATIVLSSIAPSAAATWAVTASAVRNDSYSLVTPSRTADGACQAIEALGDCDVAFVNAHGTGTMFNDQMEAVALSKMGLCNVPVNALKGYFGHTLGAAGVLETVISMAAADARLLPGTNGFSELGVSGKINISGSSITLDGYDFIKIISGFGGGNGALKVQRVIPQQSVKLLKPHADKVHSIHIASPGRLSDLYRANGVDYQRFFKMDGLSRLGFMAAELLPEVDDRQGCAVVLCCHSSSVVSDSRFIQSFTSSEGVSPSLFIYTLPNIVTGEIAIRHGLRGETSLYILPRRDDELVWQLVEATFLDKAISTVIGGWIDYTDDEHYEADMYLACKS